MGVRYDSREYLELVPMEYRNYRVKRCHLSEPGWDFVDLKNMARDSNLHCAALGTLDHYWRSGGYSDILFVSGNDVPTPSEVIQEWHKSDGHRKQMKCETTITVGLDVYKSGNMYYGALVYKYTSSVNEMVNEPFV